MPTLKCPICGREESSSLPFVGGLCIDCYFKKHPLNFDKVVIKTCKICGRSLVKGVWEYLDEERIRSYVLSEMEKQIRKVVRPLGFNVYSQVAGEGGQFYVYNEKGAYAFEFPISYSIEYTICPECHAKKFGISEATIQLRTFSGPNDAELEKAMRLLNKLPGNLKESIVSVEEMREGIDIEISDQASAKMIASFISDKLGAEVKHSYKLVSEKGGRKRTKLSISVRLGKKELPPVVEFKGQPAAVIGYKGNEVRLYIFNERREVRITSREVENLKRFEGDAVEVTIHASLPSKVIVMEPDYTTHEVPISNIYGIPEEGEKGILIFYGKDYYLLTHSKS